MLLFVVDSRIGDVEVVRQVLSGEDSAGVGTATADAVGAGLAWVVVVAGVLGAGCLLAAWRLRAQTVAVS